MTSNAGAKTIVDNRPLGFAAADSAEQDYKAMKARVMDEVKRIFRPEFLNRIDEIIVFHALTTNDLEKIAGLMLRQLTKRLEEQMNIKLIIRESVRKYIVEKGTDQKFGARPLRRAIQNELEDPVSDAVLSGEIREGDRVELGTRQGKLRFYHMDNARPGDKTDSSHTGKTERGIV